MSRRMNTPGRFPSRVMQDVGAFPSITALLVVSSGNLIPEVCHCVGSSGRFLHYITIRNGRHLRSHCSNQELSDPIVCVNYLESNRIRPQVALKIVLTERSCFRGWYSASIPILDQEADSSYSVPPSKCSDILK